jgi:hypothetical protein
MQTLTHTENIERMLESADHHIEQHRGGRSLYDPVVRTPYIPEGWILYSAQRVLEGARKGWNVRLMNTTAPFHRGSIVDARHSMSLDAALKEASSKIAGSRRATA